jgi:hypothetical protein
MSTYAKTQASDQRTTQRAKTSWIWMYALFNSFGDIDKDEYGQKCWRCCYCHKTYKESSGTLKPMQHLQKEHSVEKPTDVCKCETNSSVLGQIENLY